MLIRADDIRPYEKDGNTSCSKVENGTAPKARCRGGNLPPVRLRCAYRADGIRPYEKDGNTSCSKVENESRPKAKCRGDYQSPVRFSVYFRAVLSIDNADHFC